MPQAESRVEHRLQCHLSFFLLCVFTYYYLPYYLPYYVEHTLQFHLSFFLLCVFLTTTYHTTYLTTSNTRYSVLFHSFCCVYFVTMSFILLIIVLSYDIEYVLLL